MKINQVGELLEDDGRLVTVQIGRALFTLNFKEKVTLKSLNKKFKEYSIKLLKDEK